MRRLVLVSASALLVATTANAAVRREGGDVQEVEAMRAANPKALALLEEGESLGVSGDLEGAHDRLQKAAVEFPSSELVRRRDCEVLTALGRKSDAINACSQAMQESRTNGNARALVRALVGGPNPPTPNEVAQAMTIVAFERRRSPGMGAPVEMACDIAESLGDAVMLEHCAEELERVAPDDLGAQHQVRTLLEAPCPPARFWTGWLALAAAVVVTIGDIMKRALGLSRRKSVVVAAAALLMLLGMSGAARAEGETERPRSGWLSKWPIDDDDPERGIPTEKARNDDPLQFGYWLQDVALKAERAEKRGDHAAAARFYEALSLAVPDRAVSFTKMCDEYEAMGDLDQATKACGDALLRDGVTVKDYSHFVRLILAKPGPVPAKETAALGEVLKHMREDPAGREAADTLECEVGVRTSNVAQLKECTAALTARAPDAPETITYQWALAIEQGQFGDAEKLLERARSAGVSVDKMAQTTAAGEKRHRVQMIFGLLAAALILGGVGFAGRTVARRRLVTREA